MLRVQNVSHRYGDVVALSNVAFEVQRNTTLGLIGPNGSGKSTLLDIISGFVIPTCGDIWLDAAAIAGLPVHQIARRGIARLFQGTSLCRELTVFENLALGGYQMSAGSMRWSEMMRRSILDIAVLIGLSVDRLTSYPSELSFFEQRMVEIGRCLMSRPKLLLLDEATSGLTDAERARVLRVLLDVKRYVTVVAVEHDMPLIEALADRVIVLSEGQVFCEGSATDVLSNTQVMQAYLGSQYVAGK
jgi:ABC-type branched-subunit amino acid transport system ATPase component